MSRSTLHRRKRTRGIAFIITALVASLSVLVILANLQEIKAGVLALQNVSLRWLMYSLSFVFLAPVSAAMAYHALCFRPIPIVRILGVQYAGLFINRLLPWGVGNISLFVYFLYRQKHTLAQASAIVAVNNITGFVGHLSLLTLLYITVGIKVPPSTSHVSAMAVLWVIVVICVLVLLAVQKDALKKRVSTYFRQLFADFLTFKKRPLTLFVALCWNIANSSLQFLVFYFALLAFGVHLDIRAAILAFTGTIAVMSVTPTPGGIGGTEIGLAAILISYNLPPEQAITAALGYRLLSYWAPLVPGAFVAIGMRRRRYL